MGRIALFAVLGLLVLQCSAKDPYQITWHVHADARAYNLAAKEYGSVWSIIGSYIGQVHEDQNRFIVQFADLQTAYMNGIIETPALRDFRNIPEEANAIYRPIIVDYSNSENFTILHDPEDPVWSLNMKRAFSSVFLLLIQENSVQQQTLFGRCNVTNIASTENERVITNKAIIHNACEENSGYDYGISPWDPTRHNHIPVNISTTYIYYYNSSNPDDLNRIDTSSVFQYQSMPGIKSLQYIEQQRRYLFEDRTTTFQNIDISALTTRANITFDFSNGYEGGRDNNTPRRPGSELINEYNERYEEFREQFNAVPLRNRQRGENFTLHSMIKSLYSMDQDTLQRLSADIFSKEDNLYQHLFLSYLPYLGTNASLEFIRNLIENEDENMNDLLAIKMLSTFPVYIDETGDELVQGLRPLLNLNVSNSQVKYAGILSFASLVNKAGSSEIKQQYFNLYYKHFIESEEFEVRMTYLLGLINMREGIFLETIYQICMNQELSHHLRVLAIFGFKPLLKSNGIENYRHFWPVVQNHTEHYEVRAAALDLLLYSDITHDQFQSIISWYHDNFENPDEQHLANYLYTTIQALENSTGYYDYLGEFATEAIETIKPIRSEHVWTSGNYRMAFTDNESNFGGSMQARLIANPNTNVANVAILSLDCFAVSLNLGSYTAYIKTQGIPDISFIFAFINSRDFDSPVPKLMELIRTHGYRIKDFEDAHIEVVLFSDDRAVFGIYVDKNNIDNYSENPLFLDLLLLVIDYNSLTFPLFDFSIYSSDLGTSIKIHHDMTDFSSYELENIDKFIMSFGNSSEGADAIEYNTKYRSIWAYTEFLENYNPIVDGRIQTYRFVKEEQLLNIPYSFNLTDFVFKWKHINNSYNYIEDKVLGVAIEEEHLAQYCPSCEPEMDIPIGNMDREIPIGDMALKLFSPIRFETFLGVSINATESSTNSIQQALNEQEPIREIAPLQVFNTHKSNSFAVQYGRPILLLWHYALYDTFLDNDLYSISIRTETFWNEPTETVIDLDIDANDIRNDRDPISSDETAFTLALTTRKCHNAEVLAYFNTSMVFTDKSVAPDSETQPHIEHNYDIQFYFEDREVKNHTVKICLNREELYPNRRVNKFSLEPVEPTRATTRIRFASVQNISEDCSDNLSITFTEIYTASERQRQLVPLEEHEKCLQQSKGFKFVPPTADCLNAHRVASAYDAGHVYVDLSKLEDWPKELTQPAHSEFGLEIFEFRRLNSTHLNVSLSQQLLNAIFSHVPQSVLDETTQVERIDPTDIMNLSPSIIAYDDHDLLIGVSSACYISPNQIRTFHGRVLNDYNSQFGPDAVAFVECLNQTQSGLTIHRLDDTTVGFNFWSENNTLVATGHDGRAKVAYNGNAITETNIQNEDFKIYFLDQDVIFVTNSLVDIFYTTEYIALKAPSIYNNYICGLCAGDRS